MSIHDGEYYFYVEVWGGGPIYVTAQPRDDANEESQLEVYMQNAAVPDAIWKLKEEGSSGGDPKTYSLRTLDDKYVLSVGSGSRLVAAQKSGEITDNEKWVIQEPEPGSSSGVIRRANVLGGHPQYWYIINAVGTPVFLNDQNPTRVRWRPAPPRD